MHNDSDRQVPRSRGGQRRRVRPVAALHAVECERGSTQALLLSRGQAADQQGCLVDRAIQHV